GGTFNVGSQEEISMLGLAERILARTGSPSGIQLIPYDQAYPAGFEDMQRRLPSTDKIRDLTGWRPTRSLDDILAEAIAEAAAEHAADVAGSP
ncbi:MAG: NAD-dependent epimerase/dehydratase family protein, partial [Acidimicrobiales bacterium]